jgi:DNA-binding LytR/AlgR family response regulator
MKPHTNQQLGQDPAEHKAVILIPGTFLFAKTNFLWSVLYFHRTGQYVAPSGAPEKEYTTHIEVDTRGVKLSLALAQIECILASGDYVELVTTDHTYLKKETISALEQQLNPACFLRVHRSAIINTQCISTITRAPGATYKITLECGQEVTSSRSYRAIIDQLQLTDGE